MQRAVCGNAARTVPPRGGGGNPAVYSIEVHNDRIQYLNMTREYRKTALEGAELLIDIYDASLIGFLFYFHTERNTVFLVQS